MRKQALAASELAGYINLERLTFLVDGIFAITMTLLVLELRPPEEGISNLTESLVTMLPRLYVYFIAFYSIANYWVAHQRLFRHITRVNTVILWLTIIELLFITLTPACTAIIGRFPGQKLAAATFSGNSFLHALACWASWAYLARNHRQFAQDSDERVLAISAKVWLIIMVGWLFAILLGFFNVYMAYASWIVWPNLAAVWRNHKGRLLAKVR